MKRIMKNIMMIALVMALIVVSANIQTVSAAEWRTGNLVDYNKNCGYTTVCLKNTKKDAYVKIYAYKSNGKENKDWGTLLVTLRTTSGKYICEFETRSGNKLRLGKDHSAYRIYIKRSFAETYNPKPKNKAVYWGLKTHSNCTYK